MPSDISASCFESLYGCSFPCFSGQDDYLWGNLFSAADFLFLGAKVVNAARNTRIKAEEPLQAGMVLIASLLKDQEKGFKGFPEI